jgi:hypothetical protein
MIIDSHQAWRDFWRDISRAIKPQALASGIVIARRPR